MQATFSGRGSIATTWQPRSRKNWLWSPTPAPNSSTLLPRKSRRKPARCSSRRAHDDAVAAREGGKARLSVARGRQGEAVIGGEGAERRADPSGGVRPNVFRRGAGVMEEAEAERGGPPFRGRVTVDPAKIPD